MPLKTCSRCGAAGGCACQQNTRVERLWAQSEPVTQIHPLLPGDMIDDRFRVQGEHARGAMGVVYAAQDLRTGQPAAVKILLPELCRTPEFQNRFAREARVLLELRHPNIVPVLGFGVRGALPWLAMPLLEGKTLERHLRSRGRLAHVEVAQVATQIGSGLAHLHARGMVHRDLKASNIFAARGPTFTLLDLGVVLDRSLAPLTRPGLRMGTPAYMAPEQVLAARVDARADIYSFGIVLYELLTGELPFNSEDVHEVLRMHRFAPVPSAAEVVDDVPRPVAALLQRAMAKDPADRMQTVGELCGPLGALLSAERTL
jgi:serine/threonine protein kinase